MKRKNLSILLVGLILFALAMVTVMVNLIQSTESIELIDSYQSSTHDLALFKISNSIDSSKLEFKLSSPYDQIKQKLYEDNEYYYYLIGTIKHFSDNQIVISYVNTRNEELEIVFTPRYEKDFRELWRIDSDAFEIRENQGQIEVTFYKIPSLYIPDLSNEYNLISNNGRIIINEDIEVNFSLPGDPNLFEFFDKPFRKDINLNDDYLNLSFHLELEGDVYLSWDYYFYELMENKGGYLY